MFESLAGILKRPQNIDSVVLRCEFGHSGSYKIDIAKTLTLLKSLRSLTGPALTS